jgi:hypothetical protein
MDCPWAVVVGKSPFRHRRRAAEGGVWRTYPLVNTPQALYNLHFAECLVRRRVPAANSKRMTLACSSPSARMPI